MSKRQDATPQMRRRRVIGRDEDVTEAIIDAVATAEGVDPDSVPPLEPEVDPDALNSLFAAKTPSPAAGLVFTRRSEIPSDIELRFQYAGYDVAVTEDYVALD